MTLALEQILNGFQFGIMLFLLAAGLTLIFGIMNVINLAHGCLYMIGAYVAALVAARTGSFLLSIPAGLIAAGVAGLIIEFLVIRRLYDRDHLQQVLATFGLILFINEGVTMLFGRTPLFVSIPPALSGSIEIIPGIPYPTYQPHADRPLPPFQHARQPAVERGAHRRRLRRRRELPADRGGHQAVRVRDLRGGHRACAAAAGALVVGQASALCAGRLTVARGPATIGPIELRIVFGAG